MAAFSKPIPRLTPLTWYEIDLLEIDWCEGELEMYWNVQHM